jgi:hypothetical protein
LTRKVLSDRVTRRLEKAVCRGVDNYFHPYEKKTEMKKKKRLTFASG